MRIVVTGGAGFIGSNFIHYWIKNHPNDEIVNFDALTYAGNLENHREIENLPNYTFIHGDIRDAAAVRKAFEGADAVVHFAAETHVDRSILNPSDFVTTNVVGTQVVLDAVKDLGIQRFHHVSTDEVFGTLPLDDPSAKFSESTPYSPRSPYSASKAGSDHLVRAYGETFGIPFTITNCSNNYGGYMFPEKFIPLAVTNVLEGKPIPIYGNGMQVRDWLFVEDHCRAIELVLLQGKIGETYCVGGMTQDIPNIEVAKRILQILGKSEEFLTTVTDRPGHDVRYAIDWSKIHRELGWSPSVTWEEGLQKTVEWYQNHEDWWKRVKSGSYQEYYQKQYGKRLE